MVSTFLVTWPSNKKLILLIKVTVLYPGWSRNQMALLFYTCKGKGIKEKLSYCSLECVVCQKGAKEEKAQNFRCAHKLKVNQVSAYT